MDSEDKAETGSSPLEKVIQKLHQVDAIRESTKQFLTANLVSDPDNKPVKSMEDREVKASNFNELVLERIEHNSSAVFQTLVNSDSTNTDSLKTDVN